MFNRSKKPEENQKKDLSQFGLFEVPDDFGLDNDVGMDSGGDSDFEAELAAIAAGDSKPAKPKPRAKPKQVVDPSELDKMVADSLRDFASDEELSGDEDDLLNELSEITGDPIEIEQSPAPASNEQVDIPSKPSDDIVPTSTQNTTDLIKNRLELYRLAEKLAKESGDATRARSRGRGIKTLESLLKQALAGKPINVDDIPPEVSVKPPKPPQPQSEQPSPTAAVPTPQATTPSSPTIAPSPPATAASPTSSQTPPTSLPETTSASPAANESLVEAILARQGEYKAAALAAKKSGDKAIALQYVKIIKVFDTVLAAARAGQPVDLSDMPPPPNELPPDVLAAMSQASDPAKEEASVQKSAEEPPKPAAPADPLPPPPTTILEALTQRLEKYKVVEARAKEEGNDRKARQTGRIVKQYQDAIRMHKAGKPVAFEELPTPPGFGPIPAGGIEPPAPASKPTPVAPKPTTPSPAKSANRSPENPAPKLSASANKTVAILQGRAKEFKEAALNAKKAGDLEEAKEHLRHFKQIEILLKGALAGESVDLTMLPLSPRQQSKVDDAYAAIDDEEPSAVTADMKDAFTRLEKQLHNQLEKCKKWSEHHKALGDIANMNRFDNLALNVQKDLDFVKIAHRKGLRLPKFHIEPKTFNIVMCNTDLPETEIEITVVRGISYNVLKPRDVDTYVKVEFPYPQETPYRNKTQVIYDTDSPEYNEKFLADIQPKSRACQRVFKRQSIKFEVYSKGGFFRSDTLIGTASVKLQPLETTCTIHDSFDLMDGRKVVGGKLEIKVRTRNPVLQTQVITESERWIIVD